MFKSKSSLFYWLFRIMPLDRLKNSGNPGCMLHSLSSSSSASMFLRVSSVTLRQSKKPSRYFMWFRCAQYSARLKCLICFWKSFNCSSTMFLTACNRLSVSTISLHAVHVGETISLPLFYPLTVGVPAGALIALPYGNLPIHISRAETF